jgi:hypothetical protein
MRHFLGRTQAVYKYVENTWFLRVVLLVDKKLQKMQHRGLFF